MTEHYWVKLFTVDRIHPYRLEDPVGYVVTDHPDAYDNIPIHDYITLTKAVRMCDYIMGSGTPYPMVVFTQHITAAEFAPAPEGTE